MTGANKEGKDSLVEVTAEIEAGNLKVALKLCRQLAKQMSIPIDNVGIKNLRIHDLRRTLGSWQAITGASQYIIGKSLGHKSSEATNVYARLYNDPVKTSVQLATDTILKYAGAN